MGYRSLGPFSSPLLEIDAAGNVLTMHPNTNWSIRGIAPLTGNLWLQSAGPGDIVEVDPATGMETGVRIVRDKPGSLPAGLSDAVGGAGGNGSTFDLIGVDQWSSRPWATTASTRTPRRASSRSASGTNRWQTLTFRFAPGMFSCQTFEFDVDTDGGVGISGRAQAGLDVSITLDNGTVLNGTLQADEDNRLRAFVAL